MRTAGAGRAAHGARSGGLRRPQPQPPSVGLLARCALPDLPDRNATLRAALYFPALAALRWKPLVAALRQRLKDQGRLKPKQIIAAAMRKLLHLCFGVLKTGKPFDPEHATSAEETASDD